MESIFGVKYPSINIEYMKFAQNYGKNWNLWNFLCTYMEKIEKYGKFYVHIRKKN